MCIGGMWMCVHVYTSMWGPKINLVCYFSGAIALLFIFDCTYFYATLLKDLFIYCVYSVLPRKGHQISL